MVSNEEAQVFEEFCSLVSRDFSDYVAVDPPDYVRKDGGIAVELVQYHQDQTPQESNARRMDESAMSLVEQARKHYEASFAERVDVYVFMHHRWQSNRARVQKNARALAELVSLHRQEKVDIEGDALSATVVGAISRVSIGPTPEYQRESLWQYVAAALVDALPHAVQAALNNKEKKIASYRKHARSVELLIYSSAWPCVGDPTDVNPSSCGVVTDELLHTQFETSFDKVHYLDRQWGKLVQLWVKNP